MKCIVLTIIIFSTVFSRILYKIDLISITFKPHILLMLNVPIIIIFVFVCSLFYFHSSFIHSKTIISNLYTFSLEWISSHYRCIHIFCILFLFSLFDFSLSCSLSANCLFLSSFCYILDFVVKCTISRLS